MRASWRLYCGFAAVLQDRTVFRNQGRLGQVNGREDGVAVGGVRIRRKVQPKCAVQQTMAPLGLRRELQLPATVHTVDGFFEVERYLFVGGHYATKDVLEVTGIKSPKPIVVIAQSGPLRIREQQQARNLDSAGRENEHSRTHRAPPRGTIHYCQGLDSACAGWPIQGEAA